MKNGNGFRRGVRTLALAAIVMVATGFAWKGAMSYVLPNVDIASVNPGSSIDRDLCLTISLGGDAASECGDLRLGHGLPSARTMGQTRAPALIYNSAHAHPYPIVAANVTLPDGIVGLSRVEAVLRVNGVARARGVWKGATWPSASPVRIALGFDASGDVSNVYRYSLEVTSYYGATSNVRTVTGDLAVVNRKTSAFGGGWWLAGLDRLLLDPSGNPTLWIGGDGSVRRYRAAGTDRWSAQALDRPDTLKREGTTFVRLLPGGVKVVFDQNGRHVATRNRLNHETTFGYDGSGRLASIVLPSPDTVNGVVQTLRYDLRYGASGILTGVDAPGLGSPRVVTIYSSGTTAGSHVDSIQDPDGTRVRFRYLGPGSARVTGRVNRAGTLTRFGYDAGARISSSRLDLTSSESIVTKLRSYETLGLGNTSGTGAAVVSTAYALIDGPRTDVGDSTRFALDRFGAPTKVIDALGNETTLARTDSRFPALVTRIRSPNGQIVAAAYDARGNITSSTDSSSFRDEPSGRRYATTNYTWDPVWDNATGVTSAEGVVSSFGYDAQGNRLWQQTGTDTTHRVRFTYSLATGQVTSIQEPLVYRPDSIFYGKFGNPVRSTSALGIRTGTVNDSVGRVRHTWAPIDASDTLFIQTRIGYDVADRVVSTATWSGVMDSIQAGSQPPDTTANGDPIAPTVGGSAASIKLRVSTEYGPEGTVSSVTRSSVPDSASVSLIRTRFEYDAALRKVKEIAPDNAVDRFVYDPAGNVLRHVTRRTNPASGDTLVMTFRYDVLGRVTERAVPSVVYPSKYAGLPTYSQLTGYDGARSPYPLYPTDPDTSYRIKADTARFAYDVSGNVIVADNGEAQVRRSYFTNGQLKGDTLKVRTVAPLSSGGNFTSHVYGLEMSYDLDGRRTELRHPGNIAPVVNGVLKDRTTYSYDESRGFLSGVTDVLGNPFTMIYSARGILSRVNLHGGVRDLFGYDAQGRLTTHRSGRNPLPDIEAITYRDATFQYDVRDKLTKTIGGPPTHDTLTATYTGLGHIKEGRTVSFGGPDTTQLFKSEMVETVRHDALANQLSRSNVSILRMPYGPGVNSGTETFSYQSGTGRLLATQGNTGTRTIFDYDGTGNEVFRHQDSSANNTHLKDRASYYGADGTLRAADARYYSDLSGQTTFFTRSFDEYRYDALGRRVLVRSRQYCRNDPAQKEPECRLSTVRRTVWDGSEELYEIQMPGSDSTIYLEIDKDLPPQPIEFHAQGDTIDLNRYFGRVAYTNALGIDQPLSVIRMDYGDRLNARSQAVPYRLVAPFSIAPLWNERGQPYNGVFEDGSTKKCESGSGVGADTTLRCVEIYWPESWIAYNRPNFRPDFWHGSLLVDKKDNAGTLYRRNRYYDPDKGKFTQEDPIGLAGGVNLYGFADGDPVNFDDPFGLCTIDKPICHWIEATSLAIGSIGGFVAGGGGPALTGIGIIASPALAASGAIVGASVGLKIGKVITGVLFNENARVSRSASREGAQDKILSSGEIGKLKKKGVDVHALKGGKKASRFDLYKNRNGEILVKPKGGRGEGDPTGLNIKDY